MSDTPEEGLWWVHGYTVYLLADEDDRVGAYLGKRHTREEAEMLGVEASAGALSAAGPPPRPFRIKEVWAEDVYLPSEATLAERLRNLQNAKKQPPVL